MSGNTFGEIFRVTTFGESHGEALGCIIDGCPAGLTLDLDFIQKEMDRRKPGKKGNAAVTARNENDIAHILSGTFEGKTTGTPIAINIINANQHSSDYNNIKDKFRPGHADYTFYNKYGLRDYRGGGRSSGRETCARVAAGAIAKLLLKENGIKITAYTKSIGSITAKETDLSFIEQNPLRTADKQAFTEMQQLVEQVQKEGDSIGGVIECVITGCKPGLGEPVFDKADALLAQAMLSIGAIKGIEFGIGFEAAKYRGSQNNDSMRQGPSFTSNNAGGILGGITRGDDIIFRIAVKPVPSIYLKQQTIDTDLNECDIEIQGRHDVCLCPRIVPVVESMAAITIADLILRNNNSKLLG